MSKDKAVIGEVRSRDTDGLGFRFLNRSWWRGRANGFLDPGHRGVWS